jgi:hypothetical protein
MSRFGSFKLELDERTGSDVGEEGVVAVVFAPRDRTDGADVDLAVQLATGFLGKDEQLVEVRLADDQNIDVFGWPTRLTEIAGRP